MRKTWQAWTLVDFGQASSGQDGRAWGGDATDCAEVGQARTFAAADLARSMTLKSCWVKKP